ncbi:type II CRISPR-associated endonuclease Cas1 [Paratractidigestivibacter sp.]|uniref:type II CRISPR-associated endonuclease Cas1 n=1 Tax=Paratractidigestivibacter sp. TaxID=2847316 RepID=UPI003AB21DCF
MSGFRSVVIESPCKLSYKGGYMVVRKEDDTTKVHLSEFHTLVLHTNQAYISAYLMSELAKSKISLVVSDERHDPVGQYLPLYGAHNTSARIEEQLGWGPVAKKQVWQRIVRDKILHQSRVLGARAREEDAVMLEKVAAEVRSGDSTHREAHAAHVYFRSLFGSDFSRDEDGPINAALNYGYALLLSSVNREVVSRGYLTQEGICHHNDFNQFNLSCDFMEPFRPIVDRVVFDNVGDEFTKDDKLLLVDMLNQTIPYRGGSYRVASVISLYVKDCLNALAKRLSVDDIEPFDVV